MTSSEFAHEIIDFATYLAQQPTLAGNSVQQYVLTMRRYASLFLGIAFSAATHPAQHHRLKRLLANIVRWKISEKGQRPRNPIPLPFLDDLLRDPDVETGYKAAITWLLAILGRPGDILPASQHDPDRHLCLGHLQQPLGRGQPVSFAVWRKADTKKPQAYQVERNDELPVFCPLRHMAKHLYERKLRHGRGSVHETSCLFAHDNGVAITSRDVTYLLKKRPGSKAGYVASSMRTTGATLLAAAGVPDDEIKRAGGWQSDMYDRYVRPSTRQYRVHAKAMLSANNWTRQFPPLPTPMPATLRRVRFQTGNGRE